MNDRNESSFDASLADFTDQLLSGKKLEEISVSGAGAEIERLQKTISRLAGSLPQVQPDPALRNRIRANLVREWQARGPRQERENPDYRSSRQRKQRIVWSAAFAALVIIVIGIIVAPMIGVVLPGAAQNRNAALGVIIVVVVLLGLLLWLFRRKLK